MKKLSQTKKYFAVLILVLLCLTAGVFAFGWQTYSLAYDREVQNCRERYEEVLYNVYYRYYAGEMEYSGLLFSSLSSALPSSLSSSLAVVSDYNYPYAIIDENGAVQLTTFPQETPLDTEAGTIIRRKLFGKTYLLRTDYTEIGNHKLVVGWDITFLVKDYRELAWKNALISLLLSGIFATVLYWIQRKPTKEAALSVEASAVTGAENPAGSGEARADAIRRSRKDLALSLLSAEHCASLLPGGRSNLAYCRKNGNPHRNRPCCRCRELSRKPRCRMPPHCLRTGRRAGRKPRKADCRLGAGVILGGFPGRCPVGLKHWGSTPNPARTFLSRKVLDSKELYLPKRSFG